MKFHPKENAQAKSYRFAQRVVIISRKVCKRNSEFILTKQLIRSGTSIGANLQEALGSQSDRDLLNKLSISYKEARESSYWINLLTDLGFMNNNEKTELMTMLEELLRILGASIKTLRLKSK